MSIESRLGKSWAKQLSKAWEHPYLKDWAKKLNAMRKTGMIIYPSRENQFRAFQMTSFEDTKVVWLGMDPYGNKNASGLSFDCQAFRTPSWNKICEIHDLDPGVDSGFPTHMFDGSTERWAEQGVLMLNAALTVPHGNGGAHLQYWAPFTRTVINKLSKRENPPIFVLLGKEAQEFAPNIPSDLVLKYEHPAYAARQGRKWNADEIFSKINQKLADKKLGEPIEW